MKFLLHLFVNLLLTATVVRTKEDFTEDEYDASNIEIIIQALQEMVSARIVCNLEVFMLSI